MYKYSFIADYVSRTGKTEGKSDWPVPGGTVLYKLGKAGGWHRATPLGWGEEREKGLSMSLDSSV